LIAKFGPTPSAAEAVVVDDHDRSCKVDSALPLA